MHNKNKMLVITLLSFCMVILTTFACQTTVAASTSTPPPITQIIAVSQIVPVTMETSQYLPNPLKPKIILQRLGVSFLGQDGHKVIGSRCAGSDGKGSFENYHFIVRGVKMDREVTRVVVTGDNSTLTWAWPCSDSWGLLAQKLESGVWEVFIALSSPTQIYAIVFFYNDNSMALGMVDVR